MMLTSTPMMEKPSDQACKRTVANRNKFLMNMMKTTSGETTNAMVSQTAKLIKSCDVEKRKAILKSAKIPSADIPENTLVAMKVDMGIPWEKLKTMSRLVICAFILKVLKLQYCSQPRISEARYIHYYA